MSEEIQIESVGSQLRKAREQQQLAQELVAGRLNLSVQTIDALETDDLDKLPPPSFTRGYLRAYAKLLAMDSDDLIVAYNKHAPIEPELMPKSQMINENKKRSPVMAWATLAIILIILTLLGMWWYGVSNPESGIGGFELLSGQTDDEGGDETEKEATVSLRTIDIAPENTGQSDGEPLPDGTLKLPTQTQPEDNTSENTPPNNPTDEAAAGGNTTNTDDSNEVGFIGQSPAKLTSIDDVVTTRDDTQKQATLSSPKKVDVLEIQSENDSWVEVVDANGARLMYDMLAKTQKRELRGTAPFLIFLGHAPGISMTMNGIAVKAPEYSQSSKTSRFIVYSDGSQNL